MLALIVDDSNCKKELAEFVSNNSGSIMVQIPLKTEMSSTGQWIQQLTHYFAGQKKIAINAADSFSVTTVANIIRCESNRNYTRISLLEGNTIMVARTLKDIEKSLADLPVDFVRVHQSHLVNINFITKFVKRDGGYLVLKDNSKIPVSTRKRERLFQFLEKL